MARMPHHRWDERDELKARLNAGASILMLAPRRIGKTWLLERVDEDMSAEGWLCIRIDVEGVQSEERFLGAICEEIEKRQDLKDRVLAHVGQRFKQMVKDGSGDSLMQAFGKVDPRQFLETLVESLNSQAKRTLILIDEIAVFVLEQARRDPDSTRALLYHLRKLQQKYTRVVWFQTGSVGLDVVARRHAMQGAMLGYDTFPLDPFTEAAARSYIEELCDKALITHPFEFGDGAFELLVKELGWLSPYHLRQVALLVRPSGKPEAESPRPVATPDDIVKAFDKLLSPTSRLHFAAWEEHIAKNFPAEDRKRLLAILEIACQRANGELAATYLTRLGPSDPNLAPNKLRELLVDLANDGYLVRSGNRWKFESGLLRRYWLAYIAT